MRQHERLHSALGARPALARPRRRISRQNPAPPRSNRRASAARHTHKCGVRRPPEREAIEADYLNFRSPDRIARDCGIADHSSVYRHVHATGLAAKRKAPLRRVLESIIEQAEAVRPTGAEVTRAVYIYTRINDAGEWVGSPGRRSGEAWGINPPSLPPPPDRTEVTRAEVSTDPNRQTEILEEAPNT